MWIHIILHMCKVSSGHLLFSETFYSIQWFCLQASAQSGLGFCSLHMPEDTFSHGTAPDDTALNCFWQLLFIAPERVIPWWIFFIFVKQILTWEDHKPIVDWMSPPPPPPPPPDTHTHDILEDSNFDFRCVRLCNLDIPREKWLNYLQTVETMIICRILQCLVWVCTVCQLPF